MARLPPLGAHLSVAGGLVRCFGHAADLACDAAQIFVKNASQWRGRELAPDEAAAFRRSRQESCVGRLVAHGSYLINLAATDPVVLARSREALADELDRCERLGVEGLVLHPGAHLGAGEEAGIALAAESIDAAFAASPGRTRLLLENTAGQGTTLGHRLEHLAALRARVASAERVGVCLDTCHAFAAGYAVHEPVGYETFWVEVEALLGLGAVGCLHLNDSVKPFGSRRDRHAHIGEGEIGLGLFERLLTDPRLREVPMIVETEPGEGLAGHRRDLETLRGLVRPRRAKRAARSSAAPC